MKTVTLTGRLGKKFGRNFQLDIASPAEAVRALCYQLPGFEQELKKGAYRVKRVYDRGNQDVDTTELSFSFGKATGVRIEPVIAGRKNGGLGKIILGVALVGAAFFFSGGALSGAAFSIAGQSVSYGQIALIGGLMALSGVSAMLAPKVKTNTDDKEDNSFLINAPSNMIEQGHPVPLVYGFGVYCGSVMVSAGISTSEYTG